MILISIARVRIPLVSNPTPPYWPRVTFYYTQHNASGIRTRDIEITIIFKIQFRRKREMEIYPPPYAVDKPDVNNDKCVEMIGWGELDFALAYSF
jgi:hypothetical protein